MKLQIQCECGNKFCYDVPSKKVVVLRDNLEGQLFYYGNEKYKEGKIKEFMIQCDKCKDFIYIDID